MFTVKLAYQEQPWDMKKCCFFYPSVCYIHVNSKTNHIVGDFQIVSYKQVSLISEFIIIKFYCIILPHLSGFWTSSTRTDWFCERQWEPAQSKKLKAITMYKYFY